MSNNDYVKPPKDSVFKSIAKVIKGPYSYLHPNYWKSKIVHLVLVVPVVLFIYTLLYGLLVPWTPTIIDTVVIIVLTILSAYFYPFSLWWYKQSFLGSMLDDMFYFGTISEVIFKKLGTVFFGILIVGFLAPIAGPIMLRKCKKTNMIIGDASDFK